MPVRSSHSERRDLARQLRAAADRLGRRSIDAMYRDPFWEARFGARGRQFADEDGRRHVEHLAEAIETGRGEPFQIYARWLQSVLTTRGMCSLHIHDNFLRLQEAITAEVPEATKVAAAFLDEGCRSLVPEHPAARRLYESALGRRALASAIPFIEDPAFLLSYLADAVAASREESFVRHASWVCDEAGRIGGPAIEILNGTLDKLDRDIDAVLDGAHRAWALRAVAHSRDSCRSSAQS